MHRFRYRDLGDILYHFQVKGEHPFGVELFAPLIELVQSRFPCDDPKMAFQYAKVLGQDDQEYIIRKVTEGKQIYVQFEKVGSVTLDSKVAEQR